jgi:hypothetical protein
MFDGPTPAGKPRSTTSTPTRIAFAGSPTPPRQAQSAPVRRSCNVKWKPQPGASGLRLAAELDPGNRIGPEKLEAKFDEALDQLGIALEGDGFAALAAVFGSLSAAATDIADALEQTDQVRQTG